MASSKPPTPPATPHPVPPVEVVSAGGNPNRGDSAKSGWDTVRAILAPLASLKLTVVLLSMAIFIVVAGTFAQVEKDIWEVVDDYFRINFAEASRTGNWLGAGFAWIDFDIFFPPAFVRGNWQVPGGIPFPKGWLIGLMMSINLFSAHLIRFKIQARGARLGWGLGVLTAGLLVTFMVIQSGSNADGIQQAMFASSGGWLNWAFFWRVLLVGIAVAFLAALYGAIMVETLAVKQRIGFAVLAAAIGSLLLWLLLQKGAPQLGDPSLRILWQLIKATFAGCVLLVGCILLFRKRAGVVLLHGGIGLMMFSELLVGTTAKEARMSMREGETVNYVYDTKRLELAVVQPGNVDDKVVLVTDAEIRSKLPGNDADGEIISSDELPFDLRIKKFLPNATLDFARVDDELIATSGTSTLYVDVPVQESTGVDTDSTVDLPAAYVEVLDKNSGQPIGTFLTTVTATPQVVLHEGRRYDLALRFEREYLPYKVTLEKATRENYIGTTQAKDYSSDILLKDEETNQEIKHHIWMNNPLRYRNRTFYQSGFVEGSDGRAISTLQVVSNAGWMLPYVACMIVAVGMLAHFFVILVRYLQRQQRERVARVAEVAASRAERRRQQRKATPGSLPIGDEVIADSWVSGLFAGEGKQIFARWFPFGMVFLCGIWILSTMRPASLPDDGMDLNAFGKLPIVYEGRVKPLDTLARTSLRRLSAKQMFYDKNDNRQPAIRWLLDLMANHPDAQTHKVIRIDNPDVVDMLGLEWVSHHTYSPQEVFAALDREEIRAALQLIGNTPAGELTVTQQKLNEVAEARSHLELLTASFVDFVDQQRYDQRPSEWPDIIQRFEQQLIDFQSPFGVPVDINAGQWRPLSTAAADVFVGRKTGRRPAGAEAAIAIERILTAYRESKPHDFNQAVANYRQWLQQQAKEPAPGATVEYNQAKHDFETSFNRAEPFYYYLVLYVLAGLLAVFAWLGWSEPLNRASFWLLCFTLVLHTFALAARMYISGRPPVTNLYTTGIFISWGCVLIGLILERWSKLGLGNVIAAACGFSGLLIAHLLTTSVPNFRGDTFTVMQAVLDTQFWLATHVVIINLGYAATGLAGGFGMLYILLGCLSPRFTKRMEQHLIRMTYGTLCFAIFFSFVGTVLGGLWADDSWGRFWGWDPKENGALIIVLWNAIVLHAGWDGMVKDRGLAVLSVLGNIAVTWSWFMVNELGVGLHSYGFTDGVLLASVIVIAFHLCIAAMGVLWPKHAWLSQRARQVQELNA